MIGRLVLVALFLSALVFPYAYAQSIDSAAVLIESNGKTEMIADESGAVKFGAAGTHAEMSLILDGVKFSPAEVKTEEGVVVLTSGEKDLFIFDNPAVLETYEYRDGAVEESVTIKEKRSISYRIGMPDGAYLVRMEDGKYRVKDPKVNDMIRGYIVVHKAWGRDANGGRVEFEYLQTEPGILTLVYPKGDLTVDGKEIAYPLYVDPLLELSLDMKYLAHFNYGEDGNYSLFKFVDSSHTVAKLEGATSNTALNLSTVMPSKFGNASFRATGTAADVVISPENPVYNISNQNFAVNLWANFSATINNNKSLIYGGDPVSAGYSWILFLNNNTAVTFATSGDVASSMTCRVGAISLNKWHQFTVIKNGTGWMGIYQNQTLLCSGSPPSRINLPDANSQILIPYGPSTVAYSMAPLTGYIDEASVWVGGQGREIEDFPEAETAMYVSSASSSGGYADDNSTVSLLHFNDVGNGTNFTDQTGKVWSRTGTGNVLAGNASVFGGSSLFSSGASGTYIGTSTAVSDYNFGFSDWTIDFWMNATGTSNGGILTTKNTSGVGYYVWWQASTGKVIISGNTSTSTSSNLLTTNTLSNNTWYHIALVRNGTTLNAFVNGDLNNTATIDAAREFNATAPTVELGHLTLGVSTGVYAGWLDEFRASKKSRWVTNFTAPTTPYEITNPSFTNSDPMLDQTYPVTVQFNDTTPDSNWTDNRYWWTFGDGNSSLLHNPTNTYVSNGTFTVELRVWNNNMTSTYSKDITIGKPLVDFHGSPTAGTAALEVTFTDDTQNLTPIIQRGIEFGDGQYSNATPPWTHVYATYGSYTVNLTEWTADGANWTSKRDYIITSTDQDTDMILYPHEIRFTALDAGNGRPVRNLAVTAVPLNATTDGTNWRVKLYRFTTSTTDPMNTTMHGITDETGSVTFVMVSTSLYGMAFINTTAGYNESFALYPVDSVNTVWVAREEVENLYDVMNATLTFTEPNSSYFRMGANYQDTAGSTSALLFYVNATNGTPVYQTIITPGTGNQTVNYTVLNTRGAGYYWGIRGTRTGGNISLDRGVTGKGPNGVLVDLRVPTVYYPWISLFLLFLIGSLASKANVRFFAVILPIFAALLWWFGWMSGAYLAATIPFCGVIGAMYYMKGSLRENYGTGGPGSLLLNIVVYLIIFQMMIGFVSDMGVFSQNTIIQPKNEFSNVDLTDIRDDIGNFGGVNDPVQSAAQFAAMTWATVKILLKMLGAVFVCGLFLMEMFPYIPAGFFAIIQAGIYILYALFIVKLVGKSGPESDF